MLIFQSKSFAQDDPILFINKTECDIYVDTFCGECPNGGFNQAPVNITISPSDSYLFDGECTGDFAYFKFTIDGAVTSWFVAFDDNDGNCGQDGDCIGVAGSVVAGTILNNQSTCTTSDLRYWATYHPGSTAGSECQVVVYEY